MNEPATNQPINTIVKIALITKFCGRRFSNTSGSEIVVNSFNSSSVNSWIPKRARSFLPIERATKKIT